MQSQTQQNDKRKRFALLPLITAPWVTSSKLPLLWPGPSSDRTIKSWTPVHLTQLPIVLTSG